MKTAFPVSKKHPACIVALLIVHTIAFSQGTPSITCPNNIVVSCADQAPSVDVGTVSVTDPCGEGIQKTHLADLISNEICSNYLTITRTYRAEDGCGHTVTCSQRIDIRDQLLPDVACPADLTVSCTDKIPAVNLNTLQASDNCGGAVTKAHLSDVVVFQSCANHLLLERAYQATDACGNISTCVQRIRVDDQSVTSMHCPADLTVSCSGEVPAADAGAVSITDNCNGGTVVQHVNDFVLDQTCPGNYRIERVYRASDACQNSASCVQQIAVRDLSGPALTCPKDITVSCNEQLPSVDVSAMITEDACGGTVVRTFAGAQVYDKKCLNQYKLTRTYMATDACGNTTTCTQHVEVYDEVSPDMVCPPNLTVDCLDSTLAVNLLAVIALDNCGFVPKKEHLKDDIQAFPANDYYILTRTFQAFDACGNSETCSQQIRVIDKESPKIICPASVSVACSGEVPVIVPAQQASASDNCGAANLVVSHLGDVVSGQSCANRFTISRSYQATDRCGHTATCEQLITVNDQKPPSIICPANMTVSCVETATAVDPGMVTVLDNCADADVVHVKDAVSGDVCGNSYKLTRTFSATDACGLSSSCSVEIRVATQASSPISCPADLTVSCASELPVVDLNESPVTDNCGQIATQAVWLSDKISQNTCADRFLVTRTYRATNSCGLTGECVQKIRVSGTESPVLKCPADLTVTCAGEVPAAVAAAASAEDFCHGAKLNVTVKDAISNSICINQYEITRTYSASDACGNSGACAQRITVNDETPPVVACPAAVTVSCANQVPMVNPLMITASDNCSGSLTRRLVGDFTDNKTCANRLVITRVFEVADRCGNTASCTQLITVADQKAPGIKCPADITVSSPEAIPPADASQAQTGNDNCSGPVDKGLQSDLISLEDCAGTYLLTRIYEASDACGNVGTCMQRITVDDHVAPKGKCPALVPVACADEVPCSAADPELQGIFQQIQAAFTDNSGAPVLVSVDSLFPVEECSADTYTFGRTLRLSVSDGCGNATSCDVRYSGSCYCTHTQEFWGSPEGEIGENSATEVLDKLLQQGWLTVGNTAGCGWTAEAVPCFFKSLPADGPSEPFDPKNLPDCSGPIKNTLAGELIALQLNIRYNRLFRGLPLDSMALKGSCLFDSATLDKFELPADPMVGDLAAAANEYLLSICLDKPFDPGYGEQLAAALATLNGFWDHGTNNSPCSQNKGAADARSISTEFDAAAAGDIQIRPNPVNTSLQIRLPLNAAADGRIRVFSAEGRLMYDGVAGEGAFDLQIEVSDWRPGMYWLSWVNGHDRITKRFIKVD